MPSKRLRDKYTGSPWGEIHGKLGDAVGFKHKGRKMVRAYRKTEPRASVKLLEQIRKHELPPEALSIKELNSIFSFGLISRVANLAKPVILETSKNDGRTSLLGVREIFMQENRGALQKSIPNLNQPASETNSPNLSILRFSYNPASDPVFPMSGDYNKETGIITVKWEMPVFIMRASPEDKAYILALYFKNINIMDWSVINTPWQHLNFWGSVSQELALRTNLSASLEIPKNLNPKFLSIFLIFKDPQNIFTRTYPIKLNS